MSYGPSLLALFEAVHDFRASRPGSRVGVEWELQGRTSTIVVTLDGRTVASGVSHEIGRAAVRCLDRFEEWRADQPAELEAALAASVDVARAGGFR